MEEEVKVEVTKEGIEEIDIENNEEFKSMGRGEVEDVNE